MTAPGWRSPRPDLQWTAKVVSTEGLRALLGLEAILLPCKAISSGPGEWRRIGTSASWRYYFRAPKEPS